MPRMDGYVRKSPPKKAKAAKPRRQSPVRSGKTNQNTIQGEYSQMKRRQNLQRWKVDF